MSRLPNPSNRSCAAPRRAKRDVWQAACWGEARVGTQQYAAQAHYMPVTPRVIRLRALAMNTCLIRLGSKISKRAAPTLHAMEPRFSSVRMSTKCPLRTRGFAERSPMHLPFTHCKMHVTSRKMLNCLYAGAVVWVPERPTKVPKRPKTLGGSWRGRRREPGSPSLSCLLPIHCL